MRPTHTPHAPRRRRFWQAALLAIVALCVVGSTVGAAGAIQDDGNLFSANARNDFATRSAQIERDTGKSVVVRTVATLGGKDVSAQADAAFSSLNINGVLIFASKADQKFSIKIGQTTRQAISTQEEGMIRDQMTASFKSGDFDGGLLNATDRIGRDLRAVFTANTNRGTSNQPATAPTTTPARSSGSSFGGILVIFILVIAIIAVIVMMVRRNRGSSGGYAGGGYNGGGYAPPTGPIGGYGPPQGGGGGFGSSAAGGAIGGFGGAILGNAVYDHFRDENNRDRGYNNQYPNGYPGNDAPYQDPNNDRGRVDDSYQDTGSWGGGDSGSGGDSSDSWGSGDSSGTGDWGGGGGDPGSN